MSLPSPHFGTPSAMPDRQSRDRPGGPGRRASPKAVAGAVLERSHRMPGKAKKGKAKGAVNKGGKKGKGKSADISKHVPGVGQQGKRMRHHATDDFHHQENGV